MEEDSLEDYEIDSDESRRSFMKKGALASGALALGVGASGTAAAQASSALVFAYDYEPLIDFVQVARLQQGTTNSILRDEELVDQADEWLGHIARYRPREEGPGEYFLVFTRGGSLGDGQFETDATFFNPGANLLRVQISRDVDEETPTPEEETTTPAEEETTTPAEETTEEVVVETTTTETNGG